MSDSNMPTVFVEGDIPDDAPLTLDEVAIREHYEQVVTTAMMTWQEAGAALREIRVKRLYRDYGTWAAYLREKFPVSLSVSYANNLIASAEVADKIPVPTERAARALNRAKGDPEQVFAKAVENVGGDAAKVTGKVIEEADRQVRGVPTEGEVEDTRRRDSAQLVYEKIAECEKVLAQFLDLYRKPGQFVKAELQHADLALWCDVRQIIQQMNAVGLHVKQAAPYAKCAACLTHPGMNGATGLCDSCKGCGWVPKFKHDSLPAKKRGPLLHETPEVTE